MRFHFDVQKAMVALDVDTPDLERRLALWDKLLALRPILLDGYLPDARFDDSYQIDSQKEISRIYVEKHGVSIHDKDTWQETMVFLNENMARFEDFFQEYREILMDTDATAKDLE